MKIQWNPKIHWFIESINFEPVSNIPDFYSRTAYMNTTVVVQYSLHNPRHNSILGLDNIPW